MRLITATAGRSKAPSNVITQLGSRTAFAATQGNGQNSILLPAVAAKRMSAVSGYDGILSAVD